MQSDDVYLGARGFTQWVKVSLHKSDKWRVALAEHFDKSRGKDRTMIKWRRPGEFVPGWTSSIAVLVSSIGAIRPFATPQIPDTSGPVSYA